MTREIDLESQYRSIFENAVEGIYQTTVDGRYLRVNQALAQIYGYQSLERLMDSLTDIAGQLYVDPLRRDAFKQAMAEHGIVKDFESRVYRADRSIIWITENARCVRGPSGDVLYYEGTVEDITRRKEDEEKIRLLAAVFDSVADGIVIIETDYTVKAVNPAYEAITGFTAQELLNQPLDLIAPGFHEKAYLEEIQAELSERGRWSGELTCRRRDGDPFLASISASKVRGGDGADAHYVLTCSDVTLRKAQEQRIWHHANYDLLTRLPNRWLVTERLQQALLRAERQKTGMAVLYLDLNDFKQVNDGLGHQAGDELLRLVAQRLRACTRLSDIVGRLGGDEFLVVAPDLVDLKGGPLLAEKILYTFADPFTIGERELYCRPSIGIAYYPQDGEEADRLMRSADVAMYESKRNKALRYAAFDPEMLVPSVERLDLENDLRRSLERDELQLYYQPKVLAYDQRIVGAEALIRWEHPERGLVMPMTFIPLAEESDLIIELGEWTLRTACNQFQQWCSEGLVLESISVNLSPRQFLDANLIHMIDRILEETGMDPNCLELELTESAMSVDIEKAIATLTALKTLGVRLSVDDFGTGYSSLSYLKRLPVDVVKIDRSFVNDLGHDPVGGRIIEAIIELATVVGFMVVAEGVETETQMEILRTTSCHMFQGYLFGRPVEAEMFAMALGRLG